MYILVVRDIEGTETEYELVGEAVLGRDEAADVSLPNPAVSRRHARVFLSNGRCHIEDLGSANGTTLDGEPIRGHVEFEPGRRAVLGTFEIWVERPDGQVDSPASERGSDSGGAHASSTEVEPVETRGALGPDGEVALRGLGEQRRAGKLIGTIEGMSGAAYGDVHELRSGMVVGRQPGVDVLIEDPSVSRKHAEVHLVGGRVVVRDLDSANGTFIEERPIREEKLSDGQTLTFGSVDFRFTASSDELLGAHDPNNGIDPSSGVGVFRRAKRRGGGGDDGGSKRKLLYGSTAAVLLLMVVVVVAGGRGDGGQPGGDALEGDDVSAAEDLRPRVFNLMRRGQMLMDSENWAEAMALFTEVVELDPINAEARDRRRRAELEQSMQVIFEEGNRLNQLGSLEDALEVYMKIDEESLYRRRARFQVHQIIERLQSRYDGDCRGMVRASRFRDALTPCRRYMDFACQCPDTIDSRTKAALETAERRAGVPASERWRCPRELGDWAPCATRVVGETSPDRLIEQEYSDGDIAGAVKSYYRGQIDEALRELGRIENRRGIDARVQEQARSLQRDMRVVQAKFRQGQAELLRRGVEAAHEEWRDVIEIDPRVLPAPLQSSMRREVVRRLSSAYHERGFELFNMRRFPDAFQWYRRGHEVNPDDTRIGESIRRLENAAFHYMRQARTCDDLRQILRYTTDDPPSPAHRQAQEMMAERGCR